MTPRYFRRSRDTSRTARNVSVLLSEFRLESSHQDDGTKVHVVKCVFGRGFISASAQGQVRLGRGFISAGAQGQVRPGQGQKDIDHMFGEMSEPMNDHRSKESIGVLCAIMRMPPAGAVRICDKAVGETTAGGNRALAHGRNAIKPRTHSTPRYILVIFLQHPMPVYRGALFMQDSTVFFGSRLDPVMNGNFKGISPIGGDRWPWEAPVHQDHAFVKTIGCEVASGDVELVCPSDVGDRCVFAVRVGSRCDSLILWKTGRDAIFLFGCQQSWSEAELILSGMLTAPGCCRNRARVGALEVPSTELPGCVSCTSFPQIERVLAVCFILSQGSCRSNTAESAVQKIGDQLHVEILCSRFRRCNWISTLTPKKVLRLGSYIYESIPK